MYSCRNFSLFSSGLELRVPELPGITLALESKVRLLRFPFLGCRSEGERYIILQHRKSGTSLQTLNLRFFWEAALPVVLHSTHPYSRPLSRPSLSHGPEEGCFTSKALVGDPCIVALHSLTLIPEFTSGSFMPGSASLLPGLCCCKPPGP
jgi:hypothetical protein